MELVEGKDMDALAASGPLPIPVIIFLITEVLRGLGHAHDLPTASGMRGIVHRDVSPHNVLLSWDGAVKVSDFGIAKARNASEATASVFIKGKPAYMSPEQANGQPLDGRSDLFAVGVMLWETLMNQRLFIGADTMSTLAAVLFGQIPRPRAVRPDIPKDLERVVMKLLERDLGARYATAEQAIDDLLACEDAPKNGREQLMRVLAERFPNDAPVRGSGVRAHVNVPTPAPGTMLAGGAGRMPTPAATPIPAASIPGASMPSLGAMRGAATSTLGPAPSSKKGVVIAIGASLAALAAIVIIAVSTRGGHPASSEGSGAGSAPTGSGSAAPIAVTPPPPPPPVDAAVVVDAEVATVRPDAAEVAAKEPPPSHPAHVAAEAKKKGHLSVRAFPVLTVYVDNKKLHDTPLDVDLSVGKHVLRLVNTERGKDETVPIVISDSKPVTIERM
jgi:serine/threonine-protein kinase